MSKPDFEKSLPHDVAIAWIEKETPIFVYGFYPINIATDIPTKKRIINGLVHCDETYMLTILTDQSTGMIEKIINEGGSIIAKGVFSKNIFKGRSGEKYRPIFGTIEADNGSIFESIEVIE